MWGCVLIHVIRPPHHWVTKTDPLWLQWLTRQRIYSHASSSVSKFHGNSSDCRDISAWTVWLTDIAILTLVWIKSKSSSDLFDKRQLRCGIYSKNSTLITQNGNYTSKFQHQPNTHLFFLAVVGLKKLLPESFLILFLRLITQQLLNIEAVSSLYFFVGYSQRFVCHGDVHIRWCHVHTLYCIMPLPSSR